MSTGRAVATVASRLRLLARLGPPRQMGQQRQRWAFGDDARGHEAPVGTRVGAPENPELHTFDGVYRGHPEKGDTLIPDFWYRQPAVNSTYIDRVLTRFIGGVLWFWFLYHMYYHSGMLFGHWYMPDLEEFTDEELGIPPDDAPDPKYWGNHGKPYGTYR